MSLALPLFPAAVMHKGRSVSDVLPSGQLIELFEVLIDSVGGDAWVRFRFLAPEIGKAEFSLSFAQVEADFEYLCRNVALPYLQDFDLQADVVVIALLEKPVEFGFSDPDTTQYIEAFSVADGVCNWEVVG